MKFRLVFFVFLLCSALCRAQSEEAKDREIYEEYLRTVIRHSTGNFDQGLLVRTGRFLLGTPYVSSTLEKEPENLVVNLREMDCMTFVESTLALSTSAKHGSYEEFCQILKRNRYRDDEISDYVDRLHYTSDWIYVNEGRGVVKDMSKELGGKVIHWHIDFMSTHSDLYPQLKNNPKRIGQIRKIEDNINARTYYYLPKEDFHKALEGIKDGDIIGFVTSKKGLDISHVGIACRIDGKLTFLHATSVGRKQVIINDKSIQEYMNASKSTLGLVVVRPLFNK